MTVALYLPFKYYHIITFVKNKKAFQVHHFTFILYYNVLYNFLSPTFSLSELVNL